MHQKGGDLKEVMHELVGKWSIGAAIARIGCIFSDKIPMIYGFFVDGRDGVQFLESSIHKVLGFGTGIPWNGTVCDCDVDGVLHREYHSDSQTTSGYEKDRF